MSSREGNGKVNCKIMEMECSRFMMVAPNVALIVVYVAIVMFFLVSSFSRPPMALTNASMEYLFDEVVHANSFYTN